MSFPIPKNPIYITTLETDDSSILGIMIDRYYEIQSSFN